MLMVRRKLHSVHAYDGTEEESVEGWWGEEEEVMTLSVIRLKCCVCCDQRETIHVVPKALAERAR
jgi:hypothetical protein